MYTQKIKDNRRILTHTHSRSSPQSFLQSSENKTCSQAPLALLEAKSPHFPRELGRHLNLLLTGRRYGDRRFIKWARFCRDSQLA